ncbi:Oidioi.mRNA.OKI2018_I69.chr2.g5991.t1.cds [Oikopleura dioica]|uniref:Oidioi.mRNA.OKI2018_I69.chr2.g5991.t1.cds n=1 Tax=Oikopleura dioica TaxID=34765 RepID=A0ABN7TB27_OIKDI|nr:Oidioi.mRNA.OKI2018_I69.chr2.g5991.t1.cds [Oikopleura dioica]
MNSNCAGLSITCCITCCITSCKAEDQALQSRGLSELQARHPEADIMACVPCAKCLADGEMCDQCDVGGKCDANVYAEFVAELQ